MTRLPVENNRFHPVTYGKDMIAFLSESTRLDRILKTVRAVSIMHKLLRSNILGSYCPNECYPLDSNICTVCLTQSTIKEFSVPKNTKI